MELFSQFFEFSICIGSMLVGMFIAWGIDEFIKHMIPLKKHG